MDSRDADLELINAIDDAFSGEGRRADALRHFAVLQEDVAVATFKLHPVVDDASQLDIAGTTSGIETTAKKVISSYIRSEGCLQNPMIPLAIRDLCAGKIVVSDDVIPFNQFQQSSYYQQVLCPMGIRRGLIGIIPGKHQVPLGFTTARSEEQGPYLDQHLRRADLFQRHMARAMHVQQLLERSALDQQIFGRLLDKLQLAVIVLDDDRRVLFHNNRAEKLIAKSMTIDIAGHSLDIGSTTHKRSNFDHWWRILTASVTSDGACFPVEEAGAVWEIEACRLAGILAGSPSNSRAWLLTMKEKPDEPGLSGEYLSARFGLTKSEIRVCTALCENGDALSTARALGLSHNTVRTHLKSAFKKTGSRNQLQLVLKLFT